MCGGSSFNPVSWVGGAINSIGSVLASIDPGPAIGNIGAQIDKAVGQAVPGGWATLGVAALAIAAPYLAPYLAEAAPALTVGEGSALAGTGAGTLATAEGGTAALGTLAPSVAAPIGSGLSASGGIGLTAGSGGVLGSGVAGMGGAMGTGLTFGGIGAGPASILSGIAAGAGTGSLYGGGMGTVNSLIRGTDPLKGALTGALMGGLTGASLSGIGQTLAQYGINSPTLSSAILSTAKGLASGANPSTMLANTALNTGLSYLGNQASTNLTQAGIDPNISKILASTGVGAAKAGATGGDPITGAENAALGSTLGIGLGAGIDAGKGLLTAPSASAAPATIHDYSTQIPDGTVSLAGIEGPMTTDIASQYLKNQADQISGDLAKYYPTLSEQRAALADTANKANDIYTQNQADKTALSDAISKTGYSDAHANTTELANTAQKLLDQVNPLQAQYDAAVKQYNDSNRTDRASYDLANSLAPQLNSLIPQFNTAYSAFDTANQNLNDLYKTSIEPLYTAFTTSSDSLKTALTDYSNNNAELAKTSNIIANDLQGLDKISQGQLASGWSPGEATMQAPSATADSYYNQLVNAIANPDPASTTGSQTAANVTVEGAPSTITDVGGGATTPYVPTIPTVEAFPDNNSPTGYSNNDGNPVNADGTPYKDTTSNEVSPTDIIANLPTDNTTPVEPTPVSTPVEPTPVSTLVEPTPVSTPVEPTPVEPTPVEPTPVEPTPVEPTPVEPTPVEPTPVEPTPVEPTPVPTPVEPTPVEPTPVESTPVPTPVEPTPVEPTPVPTPVVQPIGSITNTNGSVTTYYDDGSSKVTVPVPVTPEPPVTLPVTPEPPVTPPSGGGTTGGGTTGGTSTKTPTTIPTVPQATAALAASTPTLTFDNLAPGLTKGSSFKFANEPTFTSVQTPMAQQSAPNLQEIEMAAAGGSITTDTTKTTTDPASTPGLVRGKPFSFAKTPTFKSVNTPAPQQSPIDYTQEILAAAAGGLIGHYAAGESVQTPESPSPFLRAEFLRGHQFKPVGHFGGAQFAGYQPKQFAEGGTIPEGHNPQFFSEGGLNSLENAYVQGDGDGTSDSVPAMLANGEFVIPADVVSKLGNGSNDSGAGVLGQMLIAIREHAQNHDPKKLPPKSKSALAYLLDAKRKVG